MHRVTLVLLALLAPAVALGQGIRYSPGPKMKPAMLPAQLRDANASGILDWSKCADGSTTYPCAATESVVKPSGGAVAVSSPASICVPSATGTPLAVGANDLCLATSAGARIFGAKQHGNQISYSSDARSWTQRAGNPVTVTYSATGGPTNGPYSALVGVGAAGAADIYLTASGFTSSGAVATEIFLKKSSASGTLTVANISGADKGTWAVNFASLGSGWELITKDHPAVTVTSAFLATGAGNAGLQFTTSSGTLNFSFALATQQDSAILGPPVESAGLAVTGAADVASVATTIKDPAKWCVGIKATPSIAWASGGLQGLLTGGALGSANSFNFYASGGVPVLQIYDGAGATLTGTATTPASASATTAFVACSIEGGAFPIYVNGTRMTVNNAGAGTGVLSTVPASITIGLRNTSAFNGSISKVCQGKDYKTVARCLQ